ncbi:MAG: HAMP domain-containing histidine kinase [Sphingobacteriales bacterium]|nr:MAG: HAMP domain-containing histidine kinase [Sphingobacteriales bacterium]
MRFTLPELRQQKRWKILLLLGAVLISASFLLFTNYLVHELSLKETQEVKKIGHAYEEINNPDIENFTDILYTIQSATIPIIVVNQSGKITNSKNLDSTRISDTANYLMPMLRTMRFYNDPIPIKTDDSSIHYIYFKEQKAITLLRYFPYIQVALIALFLTISYIAFDTNRMYVQNKVWVGMAKETAHQIGTPLSSLIAWVEYLRTTEEAPGEEILDEIEKDINRLEVITERFSKIGSVPELHKFNVYEVVQESVEYMRKRISGKVNISISEDSNKDVNAMLNKNLFSWVIENLTKNAVDAMSGTGSIIFHIRLDGKMLKIDIKDTGKGIPRSKFQEVFEPGFTTRKRGWGLGLSLSKRIIENYHSGNIYVKDSEVGVGTTFRIKLHTA